MAFRILHSPPPPPPSATTASSQPRNGHDDFSPVVSTAPALMRRSFRPLRMRMSPGVSLSKSTALTLPKSKGSSKGRLPGISF